MSVESHFHTPPQEAARDVFARILKLTDFQVVGWDKLAFLEETGSSAIFAFFPHTGHLDSPAVRMAVPPNLKGKLLYPAAADYWHKDGVRGRVKAFMSSLVVPNFPMYRYEAGIKGMQESLDQAAEFLRSGYSLVASPEGTRSDLPLQERQLRTGVAELALMTRKPIIPVGLIGMEQILPRGRIIPSFREDGVKRSVRVVFGEAINLDTHDLTGERRNLRREISAQLKADLVNLCTDVRTGLGS